MKDEKALASFINENVAFKAAEDVKRMSRPQTPDEYKLELPADFRPPEGIEFKFKDGDPLLAQAKAVMHEIDSGKLSGQQAFSKLLGLYAGAQVADQQTITTARNAEIAKLGAAGPARVTAMNTWLEAMGVPGLKARVFTAGDVQAMESLITRFASQGGAPFSAGGRVAPDMPGRVDSATYEKMTFTEKKEYAAKFPQTNGAAA